LWWKYRCRVSAAEGHFWAHMGILVNVGDPGAMLDWREVETAARALNLEVVTSEIRRAEDIASAFDALKAASMHSMWWLRRS